MKKDKNTTRRKPSDRIKEVANIRANELARISCFDGGLAICQLEEIMRILDEFDEVLTHKGDKL